MKKLMYLAVFALSLGFTACGSDDDGGATNCRECQVLGLANVKLCDLGDGKVEVTTTVLGQSETETIDLEDGQTFEQLSEGTCDGTISL